MRRYVAARVGQSLIVVLLVTTVSFFLIRLAPGDPFSFAGEMAMNPAVRDRLRAQFGYNRPMVEQFVLFGKALNRREGSLGQLVNNPDLYQNLNAAAANVEQLTRRLRPIVEDARIFTDKIARDPGVLGVRGALKKNSGIK